MLRFILVFFPLLSLRSYMFISHEAKDKVNIDGPCELLARRSIDRVYIDGPCELIVRRSIYRVYIHLSCFLCNQEIHGPNHAAYAMFLLTLFKN